MENDFSAIRSLKELKNLLDAGAITQQEYEALKKKIIFGSSNSVPGTGTPLPTSHIAAAPEPLGGDPVVPEYDNEAYVAYDDGSRKTRPYNPDALGPEGVGEGEDLAEPRRKDMLVTILITLGVLLLLGLIAYQLMSDQGSEKLTSTSGPEETPVDTAAAFRPAPVPAASNDPASPDTLTASPATPAPVEAPLGESLPTGTAAPPVPGLQEEEIISRAKDRLESYYDDMRSAPFSAQRHFAPTVERYYSLVNTTPEAINENINTYHFPEFQDSEAAIEEGSVKASTIPGGYEVTYIEQGSALRKSKNQKQQTKARVRARFDAGFKMTYFRQEALLENTFVD
jgi:hypothetical protein